MGIALRIDPEALVQVAGPFSRVTFVLLVIVEVVVAPIPGGVIAFLASAAWGFWQSWPLTTWETSWGASSCSGWLRH